MDPRQPRLLFAGGYGGVTNFPMHDHPFWELIYMRTGSVRTQHGPDVIEMRPGMALLHPPLMPHADWVTDHYEIFFLQIDFAVTPDWPHVIFDDERQSIGQVCDDLCREFYGSYGNRDHMIDLLMRRLVLLLDRAADNRRQTEYEQTVAAVRRIIDERYHTHLTVDELAAAVGVSRTCVHVSFSRVLEESPMSYLRTVRLRHALGLIRHTGLTLDTIAESTGFHSSSHLTRHIKALTGLTPGALRRERALIGTTD